MSSTPSISLSIKSNTNTNSKKKIKIKKKKAQTKNVVYANDIYKKMKNREHIYEKPDTYVGSAENEDIITYVFDNENNMIVQKELRYPPAWYKCFDELIVNAHDHKKRMDKQISDGYQKT